MISPCVYSSKMERFIERATRHLCNLNKREHYDEHKENLNRAKFDKLIG